MALADRELAVGSWSFVSWIGTGHLQASAGNWTDGEANEIERGEGVASCGSGFALDRGVVLMRDSAHGPCSYEHRREESRAHPPSN